VRGARTSGPIASTPRAVEVVAEWLTNLHAGSFSAPGAKEVSAELIGCALRAEGSGGTYLLVDNGGQWQVTGYAPGATSCDAVRLESGRDALVCFGGYFQGNSVGWSVAEWVWVGGTARSTPLLRVEGLQSLATEVCEYPGSGPIIDSNIPSLSVVDLDGDGLRDVRIVVAYAVLTRDFLARLQRASTFAAACACAEADHLGTPEPHERHCPPLGLPLRQRVRFDFIVRGERLQPTLGTERHLQDISQSRQFQ
jgi:hypothetical protein